jgi:hypothetical protein
VLRDPIFSEAEALVFSRSKQQLVCRLDMCNEELLERGLKVLQLGFKAGDPESIVKLKFQRSGLEADALESGKQFQPGGAIATVGHRLPKGVLKEKPHME